MNAIFYKIAPASDRHILDRICQYVNQRKFSDAELMLLNLLDDMMGREYNTENDRNSALIITKTIYHSFNDYYSSWFETHTGDANEEMQALQANIHPNILLAHSTDPESMDDLLYEVSSYLNDFENDGKHDEANYHLGCYHQQIHT